MHGTSELFLLTMAIIFTVPYVVWRLGRTDYFAPLVVVQIITGLLLGPALLGRAFPDLYVATFTEPVIQSLNGVAWWAVAIFMWIVGLELDLKAAWFNRRETLVTAGMALVPPLLLGSLVGFGMTLHAGWMGPSAKTWQFVLAIGMACAVTALPILMLLMEKLDILRQPIGQRILRYASLDDIAIWVLLAVVLLDWRQMGLQAAFLSVFALGAWAMRMLTVRLPVEDRWPVGLIWLIASALGADLCGLHFMVGAFLAGAVLDATWFGQQALDRLRQHVLLLMMPVFFLSTGLKTNWSVGGETVFIAAALLLIASVGGKLLGVSLAGRLLGWQAGEASIVGWLLQTKALIMIIFASILLDKALITSETFTALVLAAIASTMLTVPMTSNALRQLRQRPRSQGITMQPADE